MCSAVRHSSLSAEPTRIDWLDTAFHKADCELHKWTSHRNGCGSTRCGFCLVCTGLFPAFKLKKTKKRESWGQRFRYVLPLVIAFYLFRPRAHYGWLGARFVPESDAGGWVGVALTAAGVAIAIWARWHLGTNWSGVVTLKEGHELIRTGPYRTIRHPIYTGILLAFLGTAVALGEVRGLLVP